MAEVRDARVDRFITWGLTTAAALAFSVGGFFFHDLAGEVKGLRDDIARYGTRIALLEDAGASARLRELEQAKGVHAAELLELRRRVDAIEERRKP